MNLRRWLAANCPDRPRSGRLQAEFGPGMRAARLRSAVETLVGLLFAACAVALLWQLFWQLTAQARQSDCASSLKQLGLATLQYAQDWDQRLPCALPGRTAPSVEQLGGYLANHDAQRYGQATRCPDRPDGQQSYFYCAPDSLCVSDIRQPEVLGLYGEGWSAEQQVNPHKGSNNVCWADGHVKWVSPDQRHRDGIVCWHRLPPEPTRPEPR